MADVLAMRSWRLVVVPSNLHPETIVPLTELVQYFNKRSRLVRGGVDEAEFCITGGKVQMRFSGRVFGSRFQPLATLVDGQPGGHEALLHCVDGDGNVLPVPMVFVETHNDAELIYLDRMVRTLHALNFLLECEQDGGFLSLNVHPGLIRAVSDHHGHVFESVLARCGLTPERVVLEITDDGFGSPDRLATAIAAYRERGYRVAIDNFGRHSADLARLEMLAPDIVKLDRSLIGHAGHLSLAQRVMTEMSAELRRLGFAVVCQCIENPLQRQVAQAAQVDWLQGHLIGRPAAYCLPVLPSRPTREAA